MLVFPSSLPVQEIKFKTKKDRFFQIWIQEPSNDRFTFFGSWRDYNMSYFLGGPSAKNFPVASAVFEEVFLFIIKYLEEKKDGDIIEYIDNPCNCDLVSKEVQTDITQKYDKTVSVRVNGEL